MPPCRTESESNHRRADQVGSENGRTTFAGLSQQQLLKVGLNCWYLSLLQIGTAAVMWGCGRGLGHLIDGIQSLPTEAPRTEEEHYYTAALEMLHDLRHLLAGLFVTSLLTCLVIVNVTSVLLKNIRKGNRLSHTDLLLWLPMQDMLMAEVLGCIIAIMTIGYWYYIIPNALVILAAYVIHTAWVVSSCCQESMDATKQPIDPVV